MLKVSYKVVCLVLVSLLLILLAGPVLAIGGDGQTTVDAPYHFTVARTQAIEPAAVIACTPPSGSGGSCGGG